MISQRNFSFKLDHRRHAVEVAFEGVGLDEVGVSVDQHRKSHRFARLSFWLIERRIPIFEIKTIIF